jgi:tetratricopeptide (TPR) repeat protein
MASPRDVVAVLVCCLTLAAAAHAAAAPDPAQGRTAFDEGQKLFVAGDYRQALARFEKGFLATEDPAFLLNIAQCHRSLGEPKEALMMFRLYLKSSPEGVNRQARAVATKAIRELESEAATPAVAKAAPDARPALLPVAAPAPAEPAAEPAVPTVTPSGRRFQQAPAAMPVLEPLPEIEVKTAPVAKPNAPDDTASTVRHLRLAAIACGGVGLISVGTGFYYWTRASSLSDSANKAATYNHADYDEGKRAESMQWLFYGVGAVAVMTGAGLFVYSRWLPAAEQANVSLGPMVGPGAAGLEAHGTF